MRFSRLRLIWRRGRRHVANVSVDPIPHALLIDYQNPADGSLTVAFHVPPECRRAHFSGGGPWWVWVAARIPTGILSSDNVDCLYSCPSGRLDMGELSQPCVSTHKAGVTGLRPSPGFAIGAVTVIVEIYHPLSPLPRREVARFQENGNPILQIIPPHDLVCIIFFNNHQIISHLKNVS